MSDYAELNKNYWNLWKKLQNNNNIISITRCISKNMVSIEYLNAYNFNKSTSGCI